MYNLNFLLLIALFATCVFSQCEPCLECEYEGWIRPDPTSTDCCPDCYDPHCVDSTTGAAVECDECPTDTYRPHSIPGQCCPDCEPVTNTDPCVDSTGVPIECEECPSGQERPAPTGDDCCPACVHVNEDPCVDSTGVAIECDECPAGQERPAPTGDDCCPACVRVTEDPCVDSNGVAIECHECPAGQVRPAPTEDDCCPACVDDDTAPCVDSTGVPCGACPSGFERPAPTADDCCPDCMDCSHYDTHSTTDPHGNSNDDGTTSPNHGCPVFTCDRGYKHARDYGCCDTHCVEDPDWEDPCSLVDCAAPAECEDGSAPTPRSDDECCPSCPPTNCADVECDHPENFEEDPCGVIVFNTDDCCPRYIYTDCPAAEPVCANGAEPIRDEDHCCAYCPELDCSTVTCPVPDCEDGRAILPPGSCCRICSDNTHVCDYFTDTTADQCGSVRSDCYLGEDVRNIDCCDSCVSPCDERRCPEYECPEGQELVHTGLYSDDGCCPEKVCRKSDDLHECALVSCPFTTRCDDTQIMSHDGCCNVCVDRETFECREDYGCPDVICDDDHVPVVPAGSCCPICRPESGTFIEAKADASISTDSEWARALVNEIMKNEEISAEDYTVIAVEGGVSIHFEDTEKQDTFNSRLEESDQSDSIIMSILGDQSSASIAAASVMVIIAVIF